jgi:hypothetical protein
MRVTTIPQQVVSEEIQSVDHVIGSVVRITIGVGSEVNGVFQYTVPQQFDVVMIADRNETLDPETGAVLQTALSDYTDLSTEYPNGSWSTDDLWPYIDLIRSRR